MFEKYVNNRLVILYIIPFLIGSLTVLSFQPFNLTFVNFLILPILFYLTVFIKKKSKSVYRKKPYKKNLFILGTSFGFGFYLSNIHWIINSLTFDESFRIFIPFGLILIPLFLSLFFSVTILILGSVLSQNFVSILIFSGSLAFSDFLRSKILTGFPWNLWAYSFSWSPEIIQILNKLGLFAFNLILITIFTLPVILSFKISLIRKFFTLSFLILIFLTFYIYGSHNININKKNLKKNFETFNVKVVSPNFNLDYNISEDEIQKRLEKLIKYSEPENELKTLFIWPEGVFSGYSYKEIFFLKEIFAKNFNENHFILFGINTSHEENNNYFNSMIIVNNRLEIIQEYKKQKLVPFGEFLPLQSILNKFGLKKITEGHGSFLKGQEQSNLKIEQLSILPLICYEIIFPELIQSSSNETNIIINISEDGWFGNSIGPHQHFIKGVYRAIENNSFLLRSANKGISAIINNKGEILKKLNSNEVGNIELEIPLIKTKNKNKNDLIFFSLLITYILIFYFYKKNNEN